MLINIICNIMFQCQLDQNAFRGLNGFDVLTSLLNLGMQMQNASHNLPNK